MSCHSLYQVKDYPTQEPTNPVGCLPLAESLGNRKGKARPRHFGTPERFNEWVSNIWEHKVRRKSFRPDDFAPDCVLIDPFGTMRGAVRCSRYFRTLFLAFPDLSGPHFSWAANENTIIINWGFLTTKGTEEILVPSIDIFGFEEGQVSYRVAAFDRVALVDALIRAYPDRLTRNVADNLMARRFLWHLDDVFANAEHAMLQTAGRLLPRLP